MLSVPSEGLKLSLSPQRKTPVLGNALPVLSAKLERGSMYFGDFST